MEKFRIKIRMKKASNKPKQPTTFPTTSFPTTSIPTTLIQRRLIEMSMESMPIVRRIVKSLADQCCLVAKNTSSILGVFGGIYALWQIYSS